MTTISLYRRPTDNQISQHEDCPRQLMVEVKRLRAIADGIAHGVASGDWETVTRLSMHYLGSPEPLRQLGPAEYWREMGERDAEEDWQDVDKPIDDWANRYGKASVGMDPSHMVIAAAAWRDGYVERRGQLWEAHPDE